MELTTGFFIYAGLYRLAVIAAGVIAIVLGYRLFIKGTGGTGDGPDSSGTSATAKSGSFEFSVKNAAPGTCFSLFGAALIVAMVLEAAPELDTQSGQNGSGQSVQLKGPDRRPDIPGGFQERWRAAAETKRTGYPSAAVGAFGAALAADDTTVDDVARVAQEIATIYLAQKRNLEALTMVRLAVQIRPNDPSILRTLSRAASASGKKAEAAAAERRAAAVSE